MIFSVNDSKFTVMEKLPHRGDEPHLLLEIVRTHQMLMAGFFREVGMPASRVALMRPLAIVDRNVGVMDLARQLAINPAAEQTYAPEDDNA